MATKKIENEKVEEIKDSNANPYVNKVVYGNTVLMDLTGDTVAAEDVASGKKFHLPSGAEGTGTSTKDSDTSDADATEAEILSGKTAYARGSKLTGTMTNVGTQTGSIALKDQEIAISQGYHDGSGKIGLDETEKSKLIDSNIKEGVILFGIPGTHSGSESVKAVAGSATPYTTEKTYVPTDFGADKTHISQFTVDAIAYTEVDNSAGGKTVTIGTVAP